MAAPKKSSKDKPDLEEAMEESEDDEPSEEAKKEEEAENDLGKDKYVKAAKKKAPAKGTKRAKPANDEGDEDEPKPKKGKGAAKGKGRSKK